ncbi:biotin-dependent carboxyltransferase family protein [Pectobacteriaceae bacterium CE70]|uniref:Allophanate hydrolase n=1 Tax=Serratia sp. (strain ATCC 39006) TaxID=104623 RepID=A0A2I5T9M8_SERS3|nr:biotin-dependent carboxyltransferase family protein [Serratia sp. ATCC 39006]AUH01269.1 allophanate hydrolase [Serratia sp. ATCC 39006]AUH05590.1 allophanate hydrolase [Serratia sp. ATCC 39006]WJV68521.1 biotin-dependent carboxyltransferase family protein [Pectobacteriaceae bacterium CE70]WJY12451.1 biotin-dependent carboxyltransferase family protein [Pectobacteriaceae bacterium C80]
MQINVLKPGLATSVQDTGREGYYHLGIPPSGGLDQYSLRMANLLVGNPQQAAVLELTLLGPELEFTGDGLVALCGASMKPTLDGTEMPMHTAFKVKAGQILRFDYAVAGCRSYLAVAGGIDVPEALGSRSTYTLGALGGYQGRRLMINDTLTVGMAGMKVKAGTSVPDDFIPTFAKAVELRMVTGLYIHRLTAAAVAQFFADSWSVGTEADRIGYRLKGGAPLVFEPRTPPFGAGSDPSNIVDACYPIGSVQVPGGLEPIILLRDAVSGGGYMTLGTVISADLDSVGQLQPHNQVRFVPVSLEEALAARQQYQNRLQRLEQLFIA